MHGSDHIFTKYSDHPKNMLDAFILTFILLKQKSCTYAESDSLFKVYFGLWFIWYLSYIITNFCPTLMDVRLIKFGSKNFWSETILTPKNSGPKKFLVHKHFWAHNLCLNNLKFKIFFDPNNLGVWKNLGQKIIWVKNWWAQKNLVPNKFRPKYTLIQNKIGPRKGSG